MRRHNFQVPGPPAGFDSLADTDTTKEQQIRIMLEYLDGYPGVTLAV